MVTANFENWQAWAEPNSAMLKLETGGSVVVVRTSFHHDFEYTDALFCQIEKS